jgi:hypothetical protein
MQMTVIGTRYKFALINKTDLVYIKILNSLNQSNPSKTVNILMMYAYMWNILPKNFAANFNRPTLISAKLRHNVDLSNILN